MSQREVDRLAVVRQVLSKSLTQAQAALQLGVSVRQVKRLCRQVRQQGAKGLISRRRARPSNRRISQETRERFVALVRAHYADFGPQLAGEYLRRDHGYRYSSETLRGWMIAAGLWRAKARKAARPHPPRLRRPCRGELVQIDGSHHDWLEGRAPKCCLIAFIDDATGYVLAARFCPSESTLDYLDILHQYVRSHGAPLALYSDRHSIFTKHDSEDAVPTQFERALLQLNIQGICARSPQAKGRIERLFQTLQDRLCKAMRLAGVNEMVSANAFLATYLAQHNAQFGVTPANASDAHRPYAGTPGELARICALHHQRQLGTGLSCQFQGSVIQLQPHQPHAPTGRAQLDIVQHKDGHLDALYRGKLLKFERFALREHSRAGKDIDAKQLDDVLSHAIEREHRRIATLRATLAHQDSQRGKAHYKPAAHAGSS